MESFLIGSFVFTAAVVAYATVTTSNPDGSYGNWIKNVLWVAVIYILVSYYVLTNP